eukprot:TRINITY_DN8833_c0_g1_i1.p1 TRINITY_DN8833_c0_g1~~TRINITY_DN8833_c0_g1_i1.p1  ORF type:complete len:161 (+),score=0.41 TRINITY_DN8833_c0_g1_i1:181-663(+)
MELPHIGTHCHIEICQRLDYLPVQCDLCKFSFCSEHAKYDDHQCSSMDKKVDLRVPSCPECHLPIKSIKGQDIQVTIDDHVLSGCKLHVRKRRSKRSRKCTYKRCKRSELVPMQCSYCLERFCTHHHQPEVHQCEKMDEVDAVRQTRFRRMKQPTSILAY